MVASSFAAEILTAAHPYQQFVSGEETLDGWLHEHALAGQSKGTGRTFVWVDHDTSPALVVAYYTLSAHVVEREQLSRKLGRGMPAQLPCLLLGRLAVAQAQQGHGLGGLVLAEVVARCRHIAGQVGARYLIVDALHEKASAFYQHFGFIPIPDQYSLRLALRIRPPDK